jgi:hypothetical protein
MKLKKELRQGRQTGAVTTHDHKKPSSGSDPFNFSSAVQYALHSSRIECYKSRPSHSTLFHDDIIRVQIMQFIQLLLPPYFSTIKCLVPTGN